MSAWRPAPEIDQQVPWHQTFNIFSVLLPKSLAHFFKAENLHRFLQKLGLLNIFLNMAKATETDGWTGLPAELLSEIFELLPVSDLRSAMLVCKRWAEASWAPSVWASRRIVVTRRNLAAMPKVVASTRLMLVKKIQMSAVSTKMVEALAGHPWIQRVDMEDTCLSGIQPRQLIKALSNLQHINLTGTQLSFNQATDLCSSLLDGSVCLKSLSLAWNDLSTVNPKHLAEAISKVEDEVDLRNSCLTCRQTEAIFGAIESAGQPKKLCMRHNDMSEADAAAMARGTHGVEEVDLRNTSLNLNQVTTILEHTLLDTKLKKINFGFVEVYNHVDALLLKKLIQDTKTVVEYQTYKSDEYFLEPLL